MSGSSTSSTRHACHVRNLLVIVALLASGTGQAASSDTTWSVCLDQTDWPPYIHFEKGQPQGRHISLMREAAAEIGVTLDFRAMPWVRCLLQAELGQVDAIATLVHSVKRAGVLEFPPGAGAGPNRFAVDEIDDVVITLVANAFEFDGKLDDLPRPVRVPRGWEIGHYLREQGMTIDDGAPSDRANMLKLLRDRRGSVVAMRDSAEREMAASPALGGLHISHLPLRRLSYFLAFSRQSSVSASQRRALWDAVAHQRGRLETPLQPEPTFGDETKSPGG